MISSSVDAASIEGADSPMQPMGGPSMANMRLLMTAKRSVDVLFTVTFLLVFAWLYILVAIGVKLTSGGPIFYSQLRVGRNGRVFKFYKFRSMIPNASGVLAKYLEANPGAVAKWTEFQKLDSDPRITKFGRLIRRTSLDELPQFWNVLVGDMSLVGPRPCMPSQKHLYGSSWIQYCSVKPGITGLWQVSGRNMLSYQERVALDVDYVENISVSKDVGIFFKTIWVVATGHGSR